MQAAGKKVELRSTQPGFANPVPPSAPSNFLHDPKDRLVSGSVAAIVGGVTHGPAFRASRVR